MKERGYTIAEVMMVVVIIGILSVVSMQVYHSSIIRARVSEGIGLVGPAKIIVAENASAGAGDFSLGWIFSVPTDTVSDIQIEAMTGNITIRYSAAVRNIVLELSPHVNGAALVPLQPVDDAIDWTCRVTDAANNGFVPPNCRI